MKIKFDPKKAQEFVLHHVEKVLFGLVVVGFVWFANYIFIHRKGLQQTPADLMRISVETLEGLKRFPKKLPLEAKNYEQIIKTTIGRIDPKDYAHQVLWCPPIFDPLPKRGEPQLLTVRDLRAAPGCAKVYVAPSSPPGVAVSPEEMMPPGGPMPPEGQVPTGPGTFFGKENIEGERWVVLTGLVPYREQIEAYRDAFRTAGRELADGGRIQFGPAPGAALIEGAVPGTMGPATAPIGASADMPIYVHYHVQRVEVQSDSDIIDEADWEAGKINIAEAKKEGLRRWGATATSSPIGEAPDIGIHPWYWEAALDFPLPRFADGRSLDESFAHPPAIPLLKKRTYSLGPDGRPFPQSTTSLPEPAPEKAEPVPPSPAAEKPKVAVPDQPDMPTIPGIRPGMGEMGPGMHPGAIPPGIEGVGPMGPMPGPTPGSFYGKIRVPEVKLFRFIDRTVEPGKRYRYRVRLMLANPNYNQNPRFLQRPDLGKKEYIVTPWSEPSNVVEVPRDDRLLLLAVKPSYSSQVETTAKVALLKWIHKEGEMAFKEQERVSRGQLLNLPNQKWPDEDTRKTPSTVPKSPATKPSAKVPGAPGPGIEDYEALLQAGTAKKKTPREKEKEKIPPTPEALGFGPLGPQPKAPLDIDYLTECLVVDLRGGYRIGRINLPGQGRLPHSEANAPGEILLLHPEGFLYVQNELEDAEEYDKILQLQRPQYDERFGPGWMGTPPGMFDAMPPPGIVPGQLAPGETGRPKTTPKTPTPKPTYPPRG